MYVCVCVCVCVCIMYYWIVTKSYLADFLSRDNQLVTTALLTNLQPITSLIASAISWYVQHLTVCSASFRLIQIIYLLRIVLRYSICIILLSLYR
mgnify:CR=1 FL=1